MDRLRPYPVTAFCAVTLLIWLNRIWLTWTNGTDSVARKALWSVPIGGFVLAALVLLAAMVRGADRDASWFRTLVQVFAFGTAIFWAIRLPMIALGDHDLSPSKEAAFKIVHAVLAIVSVSAAWPAWSWARTGRPGETPDSEPSTSVAVEA